MAGASGVLQDPSFDSRVREACYHLVTERPFEPAGLILASF
jgi:hypothetical protein